MNLADLDAFGRMPCPGCGTPITVVTHVDKPGSPSGVTTIDVDMVPMAEHIAVCADPASSSPDTPKEPS